MKRYALAIGIGQYQYLKGLSKPAIDAAAVRRILQERGDFSLEIPLLVDERATQANIQAALKRLLRDQGKGAEVLIYFTGHGFVAGESEYEQKGYLATYDCSVVMEGDSPEERLRQRILSATKGISFEFLNGLIGEAELAGLAVLLDCCHSEWFIDQALIGRSLKVFENGSYFLSAACRSFEVARAQTGAAHSVYSGALLAALGDRGAGRLTVLDAHNSIVKVLAKSKQEPISFGFGTGFVLVDDRAVVQASIGGSEVCPYQGLNAFTPETKQFFFGRGKKIQTLVQKVHHSRFVPVIGASGSGKSSVVRAGLVPRLDELGWRILPVITPGTDPMAMLRSVIENLDESTENTLLVVDQFEEVFTLCRDRGEQSQFIQGVQELAGVRVVVTMRADFVEVCLAHGALTRAIEAQAVWLGPLVGENLETAIAQPAKLQGVTLQERLLARILKDVEAEENYLPLLEFALQQLWEQRLGTELTLAAYDKLGGVIGALNAHAEAIYKQLAGQKREHWVQQVMLKLVRTGEGTNDTRQRRTKEELLAMGQDAQEREAIAAVIQSLVDGRLLVSDRVEGQDVIDLSHEALMLSWQRFVGWRKNGREVRRIVARVEDARREWETQGQKRRYLLEGRLLKDAHRLLKDAPADILGVKGFIQKSLWWRRSQLASLLLIPILTIGIPAEYYWREAAIKQSNGLIHALEGGPGEREAVHNLTRGCWANDKSWLRSYSKENPIAYGWIPQYFRERIFGNCRSLRKAELWQADLTSLNLTGVDLTEAKLGSADFTGTILNDSNLFGAHLSCDGFEHKMPGKSSCSGSTSGLELRRANLMVANLKGSPLTSANLSGAHLLGADLSNANLTYADLGDSILHGTDLSGADLTAANLNGADLTGANLESVTLGCYGKAKNKSKKSYNNKALLQKRCTNMKNIAWDSQGTIFKDVKGWESVEDIPPPLQKQLGLKLPQRPSKSSE